MFDFPWICLARDDRERIEPVIKRKLKFIRDGRRQKREKQFQSDEQAITNGLRGEIAVSRYLRIDWYGDDESLVTAGDLEFGVEVKATDKANGNLYVSDNTLREYLKRSSHTPIVLARVDAWPFTELVGWIFAKEVSRYPFQQTHAMHNKGYLVPVEKLQPMIELQNLIAYWQVYNYKRDCSAKSPLLTT